MKTTIVRCLVFAALTACVLLNSGCATLIAAHLKNKLPPVKAEELTVTVNIAALGGGTLSVTNLTNEGGVLKAGEFHEQINTPSGSLKIDGKGVELSVRKQ